MDCTINCERASSLLFLKLDASRHPSARWPELLTHIWTRAGGSEGVVLFITHTDLYLTFFPICNVVYPPWFCLKSFGYKKWYFLLDDMSGWLNHKNPLPWVHCTEQIIFTNFTILWDMRTLHDFKNLSLVLTHFTHAYMVLVLLALLCSTLLGICFMHKNVWLPIIKQSAFVLAS